MSRNMQNADDKYIINNNPIFHAFAWQMCRIPDTCAAGATKMGSLFPDILLKIKMGIFTSLSFIRQKNFRILSGSWNVFMAPDIINALQLAYKGRKFKLAIQAEEKENWMALQVMCSLWINLIQRILHYSLLIG